MNDEYAGQGGTYLLDPATGKRTLLARTVPAAAVAEAATPAPAANAPTPAPGAKPAPIAEAEEPTH